MSIWNKLGFGGGPTSNDDEKAAGAEPTKPADNAAPAEDVSTSREVIHNSSGDEYWDQFRATIEGLTAKELNALNYRLGAGVPDFSDWHDYLNAFSSFQWYRFCEAYHWATGTWFSL